MAGRVTGPEGDPGPSPCYPSQWKRCPLCYAAGVGAEEGVRAVVVSCMLHSMEYCMPGVSGLG